MKKGDNEKPVKAGAPIDLRIHRAESQTEKGGEDTNIAVENAAVGKADTTL